MGNKYFDEDGIERTLTWMIKNRPGWTHSRMAFYRDNFQSCKGEIKALKNQISRLEAHMGLPKELRK